MSIFGSLLGGALGLGGALIGGSAAEDNAAANQDAQRQLLAQQYGWQNNSRFNLTGDLYGGGAIPRLRATAGKADFDSVFGNGAYDFSGLNPQQQAAARQSKKVPNLAGDSPYAADIAAFNASYRPQTRGTDGPISAQQQSDARDNAFANWYRQKNGRMPDGGAFAALTGNPSLGSGSGDSSSGFDPSLLDAYSGQFSGGGILGDLQDQATQAEGEGQGLLDSFDQGTNQLNNQYADTLGSFDRQSDQLQNAYRGVFNDAQTRGQGLEGLASQWGQGRDKIIRQDAAQSLAAANQVAQAKLNASGLGGSSLVANQLSSNAAQSNRDTTASLSDLAAGQIDRTMAARGQTNSTLGNLQTGNLATLGSRATQRTGLETGNLDANRQRQGLRSGMMSDTLNRNINLRAQPINTRLSLLTSPLMNPGTGINTSSFYSPSGAGSTQSAFAGALGNLGGRVYGSSMFNTGSSAGGGGPNTGLSLYNAYGSNGGNIGNTGRNINQILE